MTAPSVDMTTSLTRGSRKRQHDPEGMQDEGPHDCADEARDQIAHETATADDQAREPSGHEADQQDGEDIGGVQRSDHDVRIRYG